MSSQSPHQAPQAHTGDDDTPDVHHRVFSFRGRIGRVRMITYSMGVMFVMLLVIVPFLLTYIAALAVPFGTPTPELDGVLIGVMVVIAVVYSVLQIMWTLRRVWDFNGPTWVALIFIVTLFVFPIVNLALLLIPGTDGPNRHGPVPPPNGIGVMLLALIIPGMAVLYIVAAMLVRHFLLAYP